MANTVNVTPFVNSLMRSNKLEKKERCQWKRLERHSETMVGEVTYINDIVFKPDDNSSFSCREV